MHKKTSKDSFNFLEVQYSCLLSHTHIKIVTIWVINNLNKTHNMTMSQLFHDIDLLRQILLFCYHIEITIEVRALHIESENKLPLLLHHSELFGTVQLELSGAVTFEISMN